MRLALAATLLLVITGPIAALASYWLETHGPGVIRPEPAYRLYDSYRAIEGLEVFLTSGPYVPEELAEPAQCRHLVDPQAQYPEALYRTPLLDAGRESALSQLDSHRAIEGFRRDYSEWQAILLNWCLNQPVIGGSCFRFLKRRGDDYLGPDRRPIDLVMTSPMRDRVSIEEEYVWSRCRLSRAPLGETIAAEQRLDRTRRLTAQQRDSRIRYNQILRGYPHPPRYPYRILP